MPFARVRDLNMYHEIRGSGPRLLYFSGTGGICGAPRTSSIGRSGNTSRFSPSISADSGAPIAPTCPTPWPIMLPMPTPCWTWWGGIVAWSWAYPSEGWSPRSSRCVTPNVWPAWSWRVRAAAARAGASYPLEKVAHLPLEERVRHSVAQADMPRSAEWQAANAEQWQGLIAQTLAGLKIGADEPSRQIGARRQLEARAAHDTYDRLPSLHMPVFVCGGRYDGVAAPANQEALHAQIPGSRLELFEGGHQFYLQDPRAFERIVAFLEGEIEG